MANGAAIMARLGLDWGDFKSSIRQAMTEANSATTKTAASTDRAHGAMLAGTGKVKKNLAELTRTILEGGSAADIMATAALRLGNSFKLGMGAAVGVAVGITLFKQIESAIEEAHKLKSAINDAVNGGRNADFSTIDGLKSRIDAAAERATELRKKLDSPIGSGFSNSVNGAFGSFEGFGTFVKQTAVGMVANGGQPVPAAAVALTNAANRQQEENAELLHKQRLEAQSDVDKLAKKEETLARIEADKLEFGEKAAALKKIQLELEEKIGSLGDYRDKLSKAGLQLDVRPLIAAAKANAAAKREGVEKADTERGFAVEAAGIKADTGSGEMERFKALQKERELLFRKLHEDAQTELLDPVKLAHTKAELRSVQNQLVEMADTRRKLIDHSTVETAIMVAQANGEQRMADELRISLHYNELIAEAKKNGRDEQAKQLQLQKKQALQSLEAAEILKSPRQKAEEAQNARDHRWAERVAAARNRDAADRARRGARADHHRNLDQDRAKPANGADDLLRAIDSSNLAKDIRVLAAAKPANQ